MNKEGIELWVIYGNPSDYPGLFVVRRWVGMQPDDEAQTAKTIEEARKYIPEGLVTWPPFPGDDPCIAETWGRSEEVGIHYP